MSTRGGVYEHHRGFVIFPPLVAPPLLIIIAIVVVVLPPLVVGVVILPPLVVLVLDLRPPQGDTKSSTTTPLIRPTNVNPVNIRSRQPPSTRRRAATTLPSGETQPMSPQPPRMRDSGPWPVPNRGQSNARHDAMAHSRDPPSGHSGKAPVGEVRTHYKGHTSACESSFAGRLEQSAAI